MAEVLHITHSIQQQQQSSTQILMEAKADVHIMIWKDMAKNNSQLKIKIQSTHTFKDSSLWKTISCYFSTATQNFIQ